MLQQVQLYLNYIYRVSLKSLVKRLERIFPQERRKKICINLCLQTIFEVLTNNVLTHSVDVINMDTEDSMQENWPRLR